MHLFSFPELSPYSSKDYSEKKNEGIDCNIVLTEIDERDSTTLVEIIKNFLCQ